MKKIIKRVELIKFETLTLDFTKKFEIIMELRKRLKELAKHMIGYENALSLIQVFEIITNNNKEDTFEYKLYFWLDIINNLVRNMRSKEEVFFIKDRSNIFVLKTQEESKIYKDRNILDIKNLKNANKKADEWVEKEKWRYL